MLGGECRRLDAREVDSIVVVSGASHLSGAVSEVGLRARVEEVGQWYWTETRSPATVRVSTPALSGGSLEMRAQVTQRSLPSFTLLAVLGLALALAGCSNDRGSSPPVSQHSAATATVVDPLAELTDKKNPRYVADQVTTVLHEQGTGPKTFQIAITPGTQRLEFYVACSPDSSFTVTTSTFFSGSCSTTFQNSGAIPVSPPSATSVSASLQISDTARYWIVARPTQ